MSEASTGTAVLDLDTVAASAASAALAEMAPEKTAVPTPDASPADTAAPSDDDNLDQTEADADQTEEDDEPSEADAVTLPEGFVVVEPVVEGLVTDFTIRDADGDELEIPALLVEYKANGKVRKDRLDQVVKLAQFGVYNQEREQKVQQIEREARSLSEQQEQLQAMIAEYEAHMERLLTDEEYYVKAAERFGVENSPERRAARAEQELQSLRVEQELQQISQVAKNFIDTELVPALSILTQALPTISEQELDERLAVAMQAHLVRGPGGVPYLPESRYAALRKYIVEDLAPWAQMVHLTRSEAQRDPEKERLAAERDQARIQSQKTKRVMGQAMKPITGAAAPANRAPKAKPISTLDDAVDSALSSVLSSLR